MDELERERDDSSDSPSQWIINLGIEGSDSQARRVRFSVDAPVGESDYIRAAAKKLDMLTEALGQHKAAQDTEDTKAAERKAARKRERSLVVENRFRATPPTTTPAYRAGQGRGRRGKRQR